MARINLGPLSSFTQSRYTIDLSNSKRIVLFRLPTINGLSTRSSNTSETARSHSISETDDGWTYYAMEAECPHAGGPMEVAPVDIEDSAYIVTCPWHAYDFNIETGESTFGLKACTFVVDVRSDETMVILHLPDDDDSGVSLSTIEPVSEEVKFRTTNKDGLLPSHSFPLEKELIGLSLSPEPCLPLLGEDATLCDWCVHILNTSNPEHKIELTAHLFSMFCQMEQTSSPMMLGQGLVNPPAEPPRETSLEIIDPHKMPKGGNAGSLKSRITMLHALANIEQWAIDLAVDICVRFSGFQTQKSADELPRAFFYDWLKVANDEAKHFSLLRARLLELGSRFGALPVHHGLWESAMVTADDLRARISVIALVHEARGLDVNPMTIEKFRKAGDMESVKALEIIHHDEITHVTTGHRWLTWICQREETDPVEVFRSNVQKYFRGPIKGPFNVEARQQAGLDGRYYENLIGTRRCVAIAEG